MLSYGCYDELPAIIELTTSMEETAEVDCYLYSVTTTSSNAKYTFIVS